MSASLEHNGLLSGPSSDRLRLLAWPLGALGLLITAGTAALVVLNRSAIHSLDQASPIELILPIGFSVIGALLVSRLPRNPIGWLFLGIGIFTALPGLATQYVFRDSHLGHLPATSWIAWSTNWIGWLVFPTGFAFFFFLLFPDGRLQSRRWLWLARVDAAFLTAGVGLQTISTPIELTGSPAIQNPLGVKALNFNGGLGAVFWLPGVVLIVTAMVGTVVRTRRATGELRQQLRWLSYATGATAIGLLLVIVASFIDNNLANGWWDLVILLGYGVAVPIACGVAILKHGLYDLDVVVSKTVVYGVLAAFFTAVYLAVVVGIGTAVGSTHNPFLTVLAAALIALAFNPVRERAKRLANRIVYGKRATPYEILSEFSHGLAGASAADEALSRMTRLVVEATGASRATVWLRLGDSLQPEASWPPGDETPEAIALDGRTAEQALAEAAARSRPFLVQHDDELLGVLTVTPAPNEPLTPAGEKLIADLAAQTGLGLRFESMKERALFAKALASLLPPEVAEMVEASPSSLALKEEVEATILFSDIRGFSTLAERLSPREVADVLGRHLAAMAEVVSSHGGILDKFAGDAVMAVFGVPKRALDHAERAVACAVAMQRRQTAVNAEAEALGQPASQLGIGVNTGLVIAGTIGGQGRLDYTVLGDAVNVAQRLQNEAAGGEIIASAATVARAGDAQVEPAGLRTLKGREEPVETYRIRWQPDERLGGVVAMGHAAS